MLLQLLKHTLNTLFALSFALSLFFKECIVKYFYLGLCHYVNAALILLMDFFF